MKRINIAFRSACLLSALLLTAACLEQEMDAPLLPGEGQSPEELTTIRASLDVPQTKTELGGMVSGKYKNVWSANDRLALYADGAGPTLFALVEGEGLDVATFSGSAVGKQYYALYPFSDAKSYNGKEIELVLPATQTYAEGSFGPESFPMVASSTDGMFVFKNLCSILKIQLKGFHLLTSVTFTANDPLTGVSGPARVNPTFSVSPDLKMTEGASPSVTLDVGSILLEPEEITDLYLVLPAQTYKGGFTLTVNTSGGKMVKSTSADVTLLRSQMHALSPFSVKLTEGIEPSLKLEGEGTEVSPMLISSIPDLITFRDAVNTNGLIRNGSGDKVTSATACYTLTKDLDISSLCSEFKGSWTPVGDNSKGACFAGVFNGGNHRIKGLFISCNTKDQGFFGRVTGTVKNLSVSGFVYGTLGSGGIAGYSSGIIENCINYAEVHDHDQFAGGIAGLSDGIIKGCSNYGNIYSEAYCAGGITGKSSHASIFNCFNEGDVEGTDAIGGICGWHTGTSIISNCSNIGEIYAYGGYVGGIIGDGKDNGTAVSNCVNSGLVTVSKTGSDSSFIGSISGSANIAFNNCYWLYDPNLKKGLKNGFGGEPSGAHNVALTQDQILGKEDYIDILYTTDDNVPCVNIIAALNNWAYDSSSKDKNTYWGWVLKEGDTFLSLTGKAAEKTAGDVSNVFSITPTELTVSFEGGSASVQVAAGMGYKISSMPSWISETSCESEVKDGLTMATHTFSFKANPDYTERTGAIVFCNDLQVCVPVTVTQMAKVNVDDLWKTKDFHHRSLAAKFTATWCGYCPPMAAQFDQAEQQSPNKLEVVAFHPTSSNLGCNASQSVIDRYGISSYPTGILDMRTSVYSASSILSAISETEKNYPTTTAVSFKSSISGSNITVDLSMYAKKADSYKVTVLLLEDNIVGYQADNYDGDSNDFIHSNIVRLALSSPTGDEVTLNTDYTVWSHKYSGTVPSGCKKDNLKILVYVQKPFGEQRKTGSYGDFYVDNCRAEKIGTEAKLQFAGDPGLDEFPESKDYSLDGRVTTLQSSSTGKGIDIVITGDAFMDKDQSVFENYASRALEAFFAVEPYTSLRDRFNVYRLNAVSKNGVVAGGATTKFSTKFGEGTHVEGNHDVVQDFVKGALPKLDLTKTLIIVLINMQQYAGTCHCWTDNRAIAYVPLQTDKTEFCTTLRHEASGHGFGKLDDEYSGQGGVTEKWLTSYSSWLGLAYGFWENIDITSDKNAVKWAKFISDSRYSGKLGVYEGAGTYDTGVYRPTMNSIMRYNEGFFNTPSRESIYKKIMKFSEGDGWTYDYETFVSFDEKGKLQETAYTYSATFGSDAKKEEFIPLNPPVLHTK